MPRGDVPLLHKSVGSVNNTKAEMHALWVAPLSLVVPEAGVLGQTLVQVINYLPPFIGQGGLHSADLHNLCGSKFSPNVAPTTSRSKLRVEGALGKGRARK